MISNPERITDERQLDELLSRPSRELVKKIAQLDGDIMFLGVGGKMGISMAIMARRAVEKAGVKKKVIGISRFGKGNQDRFLEKAGVNTLKGDLLDAEFVRNLPTVKNIIFLTGMKFGSEENLPVTWAVNTFIPGLIASHFTDSRIVALSTGSIYPLVPVSGCGSLETDLLQPVGEYAQSCLGRERMFQYGSNLFGTPVVLIRLNYAVEMRYGVLVDIALKVKFKKPIDLTMGYFNVIWQGDANDMILQTLNYCQSPARILNITGPEILTVRETAKQFGKYFNVEPEFIGHESETALLNNAGEAFRLMGKPGVAVDSMIRWIAGWIEWGGPLLDKPTHYEVRDGKY